MMDSYGYRLVMLINAIEDIENSVSLFSTIVDIDVPTFL
mgnify:CR=1 FL=1